MDKRTLTALQASIDHWYRISECMTVKDLNDESFGSESCSLCAKFKRGWDCTDCPVRKATGFDMCTGSPYDHAANSLESWTEGDEWTEQDQSNIEAEIRFLESLLP